MVFRTHFTYGINVSDLELLSNIEEVTDYIFIQTETYLKSLNFLRNLRRIDGRTLSTYEFCGILLTVSFVNVYQIVCIDVETKDTLH